MKNKRNITKRLICVSIFLAAVFAFSGCGQKLLEASAETLVEEGQMELTKGSDIKLSDELKDEVKERTYRFSSPPKILIYHTHATEAYRMEGDYVYEETEAFRTDDNTKNVVYAGEVLKNELEALGFDVVHDTTNVEPPEFISAYSRSLEVMKSYDDIDIYIDLHRNAADAERDRDDVVVIDSKRCAKLFFVVGTGIGTYEGEYDIKPDWAHNYVFARSVTKKLEEVSPELVGDVRVKVGRHNQHMGMCLLAEVGHNANTLDDVLNTLPYLAQAIRDVCKF